jgi:hypothetical protein
MVSGLWLLKWLSLFLMASLEVQNPVTPVKTGVQKYLKKSAAADFRGNDKKEKIKLFTKPALLIRNYKL